MRLSDEQRSIIKSLTEQVVGSDARVVLFGSRLDDGKRGGDIDLLIDVPRRVDSRVLTEARLAARVERALGGRRVDVLLIDSGTTLQPVHHAARASGVEI
ncbi:MAG: nucleotidyltransferase domain-containing protein [Candidatus Binatia bacterium]